MGECSVCGKEVKEGFTKCYNCNMAAKAQKESGQASLNADKKYNVSSLNGSNNNYSDKRQDSIIRQFALREAISITIAVIKQNDVKDLKSTDILHSAEGLANQIIGWITQ